MKYLDLSFDDPARNLACDEALLLRCEAGGPEVLRFWEAREYFAVLGYAGKAAAEIFHRACGGARIAVLRRLSGGGTAVQGPGCLSYAVVLEIEKRGLHDVRAANAFVMGRMKRALEPLVGATIAIEGFTDLAIGGRKFSGNAQYRKRRALLFHGTILLEFDIALIEKLLPPPARQPAYRRNRSHAEFLTNVDLSRAAVKKALRQAWRARARFAENLFGEIEALARERYACHEWNLRF